MNTLMLYSFAAPGMWLQVVLFMVGIVIVLWGAGQLTDGAVGIAERMGIPQIVIGLTVVAMGTSMPEFFVSLMSAVSGTPDLAVGNVVGSNILNAMLIVGATAAIAPIAILRNTVKKDIPFALIASVILLMMCFDGNISRLDAFVMLALFVYFMVTTVKGAKVDKDSTTDTEKSDSRPLSTGRAVLMVVVGLSCLIIGSQVFVDNASAIAMSLGMSEALVGLTIVACGTSLPELATSIVAARRGNSGIAIGNVLGSNVFNILMILGITGLVSPMHLSGITNIDLSVMVLSMILLWLFSFTKYRIERWEGMLLALLYGGYTAYLVVQTM